MQVTQVLLTDKDVSEAIKDYLYRHYQVSASAVKIIEVDSTFTEVVVELEYAKR